MSKSTQKILNEADDTLFTARLGLENLQGSEPKKNMAGLRNAIVFGRAVTNVLQNLRSTEGKEFDIWYQPKVEEMKQDKILKYFYELRTQILKQGTLNTSTSVQFSGNPIALMQQYQPPPHAKGFFMADNIGGCGWEVEIHDGITEKYYVELPKNIPGLDITIAVHFSDCPEDYRDRNIKELTEYYINYLENLVYEAKEKFIKKIR